MSQEAKTAATAIKEVADQKKKSSDAAKKRNQLDMERFGDNKNDPVLKRATNFIERVGTGRQKLMNFLVDTFEKKDIKEARKIASEIIRNVDPNKSIESQLKNLSTSSGIQQSVRKKLDRKKEENKLNTKLSSKSEETAKLKSERLRRAKARAKLKMQSFSKGGIVDYRKTGLFK